jgi:hypothetical protein
MPSSYCGTGEVWAVNATVQSRGHTFRRRMLQPFALVSNFNSTAAEASPSKNGGTVSQMWNSGDGGCGAPGRSNRPCYISMLFGVNFA